MPPRLTQPFKANTGVRYGHLISQGLELHPWVTLTDKADDADLVVWLPNSSPDKANAVHSLPDKKSRLVVLDEGDHPGVWSGFKEGEYLSYFKRSWVQKKNGTSFGKSGRNRFSHAFCKYGDNHAHRVHESNMQPSLCRPSSTRDS